MKDRFSQAFAELTDKNSYVCTTCEATFGHATIEHFEEMGKGLGDYEVGTKDVNCILFCDPVGFGFLCLCEPEGGWLLWAFFIFFGFGEV
jgi:hypothetical protein